MPDVLNGCTDTSAQNYNPIANQNDGSCIYCNQIPYSISSDTSICAGDTIALNASGATNFLWSTGDIVSNIFVNPDSTQTYSVYMNYQTYCWQIASVNVSVYEDVQAGFWPDMTNSNDGDTILFVNTSTNATNYFWDFGDSTTNTVKNPRHLYLSAGSKTVMLIAGNSCSADTFYMTFTFSGIEGFSASDFRFQVDPNPFSETATLRISNPGKLQMEEVELTIYDMIGKQVHPGIIRNSDSFVISGGNLLQGIYFVRMKVRDAIYQQKIVKM